MKFFVFIVLLVVLITEMARGWGVMMAPIPPFLIWCCLACIVCFIFGILVGVAMVCLLDAKTKGPRT